MKRFVVLAALLALLVVPAAARADHPGGGGVPLGATLVGANERPVLGAPLPATGTVLLRLNPGQEEICFDMAVTNLSPLPFAAHIHVAPAGQPGPVVVPLTAPRPTSAGCVFAPRELILAIIHNPGNYYVNVHNTPFPGGALRGQLGHVAPGQA